MDGNYSLADIAAATGNGRNNDGMFGGDGAWWLIVLFLFVFCGWGNNGWGNNGNGGGYAATAATQADIQRGFDNSAVISKLDGINNGLCDGFYSMTQVVHVFKKVSTLWQVMRKFSNVIFSLPALSLRFPESSALVPAAPYILLP